MRIKFLLSPTPGLTPTNTMLLLVAKWLERWRMHSASAKGCLHLWSNSQKRSWVNCSMHKQVVLQVFSETILKQITTVSLKRELYENEAESLNETRRYIMLHGQTSKSDLKNMHYYFHSFSSWGTSPGPKLNPKAVFS